MPFADVAGGRLYYEVGGDGPPIVLLHSSLVDSRMWDEQMGPFAERYSVVRYDLRSFGRSDRPSEPYSHIEDLRSVLGFLGFERAALVGLSLGGAVSYCFALEHPAMVDALVIAAAGIPGFDGWSSEIRSLWNRMEAAVAEGDLERAQSMELAYWLEEGVDPMTDARIREISRACREGLGLEDLGEWPERPVDRISELRIPTLVVLAEREREPGIQAIGDRIAAEVPGARRVVVPRSDHLISMRNPKQFNRVVLDFLEEVLG